MSSILPDSYPYAVLALADGSLFYGYSIGVEGVTVGEVVFNTSMAGYQEILTDPSYFQQMLALTYPHIGNTGTNDEDYEGNQIYATGLIVKDLPRRFSNYRAQSSLQEFLQRHKTVAIAGIDTRKLTRLLRNGGAQNGCICALAPGEKPTTALLGKLTEKACSAKSMAGSDLAQMVTCQGAYAWLESTWQQGQGYNTQKHTPYHVVAYDFGIKHNIMRMLSERGCRLTVVPAKTPASEVLQMNPDGVFFSNGPGDPEPCTYAITAAREIVEAGVPTFGICLGHQILALACGAKTFKMKFGHHGGNHPVKDLESGRVCITSQNHGFAVDEKTLPGNVKATHVSLFDGSLQGICRMDKPAFSFQGHPEASPGPHDIAYLFDKFIALMASRQTGVVS